MLEQGAAAATDTPEMCCTAEPARAACFNLTAGGVELNTADFFVIRRPVWAAEVDRCSVRDPAIM